MSQDSAFWDRNIGGDADTSVKFSSPYSLVEYSDIVSKMTGGETIRGFVVPAVGANLEVTVNSPAAMNVLVGTGAALIKGRVYRNTTTKTTTIDAADGANPRYDIIVLELSTAAQTIRVAVVKGTAAATPALPTLTQTAATYQVALAYVYVGAGVTTIASGRIIDTRVFAETCYNPEINDYTNRIINSEFMAFSSYPDNNQNTYAPEYWSYTGTPDVTVATKPAQMVRGQSVQLTATTNPSEGMGQVVRVKASTHYSFRFLLFVTSGDVGTVTITTNSASPSTKTTNVYLTNTWLDLVADYTTEADATTLTISFLAANATDVIKVGQVMMCEGYYTGPYRPISEIIMFFWPLTATAYTNITGFTAVSLINSVWGSSTRPACPTLPRAAYILISGSVTSTGTDRGIYLNRGGTSSRNVEIRYDNYPNNYLFSGGGFVPCLTAGSSLDINVEFTAITTSSVTVTLGGIIT